MCAPSFIEHPTLGLRWVENASYLLIQQTKTTYTPRSHSEHRTLGVQMVRKHMIFLYLNK